MDWQSKYLKYKKKYIYLKNKYNSNDNLSIVIKEGDDLVTMDNSYESSRFDTVKKECKHWYALKICNEIIKDIGKKNNINRKYNILCLGVELGSIIIHLLNKLKNIHVTGVDLSDRFFYIVKKYSPHNRLTLTKSDANDFIKNTVDTYDYIICDIFSHDSVPSFVNSIDFMKKINNKLNQNGKFLLNTINVDHIKLDKLLKEVFPNSPILMSIEIPGIFNRNVINIVSK